MHLYSKVAHCRQKDMLRYHYVACCCIVQNGASSIQFYCLQSATASKTATTSQVSLWTAKLPAFVGSGLSRQA